MTRKRINLILMIGWMIIIFVFSQQPANISNENNRFVVYMFKTINIDLDKQLGNLCNFIIRKAGHFSEYFVLYIFSFRVVKDKKRKLDFIYALIIVFLYACTDEFHQLFVSGREGKFRDVIIDTTGGMAGMMVMYMKTIWKKYNNKLKLT